MNVFFRVSRYLFRYPWLFTLTQTLAIASTGFLIVSPFFISLAIDRMVDEGTLRELGIGVLVVLFCYAARDILNFGRIRINNFLEQKVLLDLRKDVHDKLLELPVGFYEKRTSGEIASRVIEDVQDVERVILDGTEQGTIALLTVFGVTGFLFYLQPTLASVVILPLPILAYLGYRHSKAMRKNWRAVRQSAGQLNSLLVEHLQGNRLISAFALRPREEARFQERAQDLRGKTLKAMFRWSIYNPTTNFIGSLGTLAVLGVGGYLYMEGQISDGALVAFFLYCGMFLDPISRLHQLNQLIATGIASGERVFEILDQKSEVVEDLNPAPMPPAPLEVRYEKVSFAYQDRSPVLHDIVLTLPAGQCTALVGHTGAGKSTIANLLLRYYDVSEGSLTLNGTPIHRLSLADLRGQIGYVSQEPFLFDGSIRENLLLAHESASEKDLWQALEAANARDFVERLPHKLDSLIGERGIRLSMGEKQRLTIARVILRNPPILILDEATSSVDTITESLIQKALDNLLQNRTSLIIAHRLSTVRKADQIIVLEQGKIVERGTHHELLTRDQRYAKMWEIQASSTSPEVILS
ncbi:MAG: ABC transporter ATP-binding protein [Opitutales bacterium]|nr:ABC transporter ATP-binding protein [Opitutales bacterium]MCH8541587.1 ABC transporter ATP-binding protein/permease [Opitutales bacterium]